MTTPMPASPATMSEAGKKYWEERKNLIYYQVVRTLIEGIDNGSTESMLDVGSGNCPYLEWFPSIPNRYSLDLNKPYEAKNIHPIKANFLSWTPDRKFDLVTCLQVLEHVPDAKAFALKLLEVSNTLVVSVPYKWPQGHTKSHVHDPVDEKKLLDWFGRKPNYEYICREVSANVFRIIQVYEEFPQLWNGLGQRSRILKHGPAVDA